MLHVRQFVCASAVQKIVPGGDVPTRHRSLAVFVVVG